MTENDLISRKALIEEINSLRMSITGLRVGKREFIKFIEEYKKSILKCIDEAPVAYNIKNVNEEIEKLAIKEIENRNKYGMYEKNTSKWWLHNQVAQAYGKCIGIIYDGGNKKYNEEEKN